MSTGPNVLVLGTGSADGWPNPFCGCASCVTERRAGRLRGQTAALLDDRLLLDCGPGTPAAAQRAGVDLSALRHVLLSHAHPDHVAPSLLLYRSWATDRPLDVVGPPGAIEQCRDWLEPGSAVRLLEVGAGARLTLGRYDVRVLAAQHTAPGGAVLYDVRGPTGRLLYATDTGPLPRETVEALRDARFDLVLLEETFGDHTAHGTEHLDLATFPEQVRLLAEVGALTRDTDVVACHLSHHNPPGDELRRRLADWGARVVPDGARIGAVEPGTARSGAPTRTLVMGGARSGKSREAERILAACADVTYVATAHPASDDRDWQDRVSRHRQRRPPDWATVETLDLVPLLTSSGGPLLVDCLTLWLSRTMDRLDAWDVDLWRSSAEQALQKEVEALLAAWRASRRRVVAVTNEVGQGVVPSSPAGVRFRDLLGHLNAALAAETEDVRWCLAGRVTHL